MIKTIRKCMDLLSKNDGLAQIPLMIALLLMAVAVPAVTKLSQQNQDNRNMAAPSTMMIPEVPQGCTCSSSGKLTGINCPILGTSCVVPVTPTATGPGLANGVSCFLDQQCTSNNCSGNKCQPPKGIGAGCVYDRECASGACTGIIGFRKCTTGSTNIPNGQACTLGSNCESGRCGLNFKCEPKISVGSICITDAECASGHCTGIGTARKCTDGSTNIPDGQTCTLDSNCSSGKCTAGKCIAKVQVNGSCISDSDCATGSCTGLIGFRKCTTGSTNIPVGQACFQDSNCDSGKCTNGKCAAKTSVGGSCTSDSDCATGSCTGLIGFRKCTTGSTNIPVGQACFQDSNCESGRCTAGKCAVSAGGQGCLIDAQCGGGYHCSLGICAKDIANSDACVNDQDCASKSCVGNIGSRKCAAEEGNRPSGASCTLNISCASGRCVSGKCQETAANDSCLLGGDKSCGAGYHCSLSGTCAKDIKNGDACFDNQDCESKVCIGNIGSRKCAVEENNRPNGASCVIFSNCQSKACLGGKCVTMPTANLNCSVPADCGDGYSCIRYSCVKKAALGQACTLDGDCTSDQCVGIWPNRTCVNTEKNLPINAACTFDYQCLSGACTGTGSTRKCVAKSPTGANCTVDSECSSAVCSLGKCVLGGSTPDNGACTLNSQCKSGQCTFEKCQGAGGLEDGSRCFWNGSCKPGSTCDMTIFGDDICVSTKPNLPDNSACTKNTQCNSGTCTFGKCVGSAGLPEGSQCSLDTQCATGFCDWSLLQKDICVRKGNNLPDNSACTKNSQCKSGLCTFEKCQGAAGLPEGSRCSLDTQCGSGLTCDQTAFGDDICVKTDAGKTADGKSCAFDKDCASGHCVGTIPNRVCNSTEFNRPNGAQCYVNSNCKSTFCVSGKCSATGIGDSCLGSSDKSCGVGNHCDLWNFRCIKDVPTGGSCTFDTDCASQACVGNIPNRKCSATENNRPVGAECLINSVCASKFCVSGKCSADGIGDACIGSGDKSCGVGNHCAWNFKCVKDVPDGGSCMYDVDCASQACVGNIPNRKCSATEDNRPDGADCLKDSVCASKKCTNWKCVPGACLVNGALSNDSKACCSGKINYVGSALTCVASTTALVTPSIGPNSCNPKCLSGWTCLAGADGKPVCAVFGQDPCSPGEVKTQASTGLGCGTAKRICKCISDKNWSCFCDGDGNGVPGCGDNLKGSKTTRPDGSTLWLNFEDEASAKCVCGTNYHQNNNGKYLCGTGSGGGAVPTSGGGGGTVPTSGGGGGSTPTSGGATGTSPTVPAGACKECAKDFRCYHNGSEYKWFVPGYVMDGFAQYMPETVNEPCGNVPKPAFLGKSKGDANCDGSIDVTDYSLWHKEFFDGDKGAMSKSTWNADFTGAAGKCDGKVDVYDFSLWQKFFSEFKNVN